MKTRALGVAVLVTLLVVLGGSTAVMALADNPHGTPPGQAKKDDAAAAPTASTQPSQVQSNDRTPPGQAKKLGKGTG